MLCCVLAVHPLAIVVSMCDQLLGHVPVTSVSEKLTDRLQRTLDDDEDEETAPELHELFSVGQWVRACVESVRPAGVRAGVGREGGEYERESQRVQLTLEPRAVIAVIADGYSGPGAMSAEEAEQDAPVGTPGDDFGAAEPAPELTADSDSPRCVN
mgnify:CR=1 FL=1